MKKFFAQRANLSKLRHTVVTADVNLHDYGLCIFSMSRRTILDIVPAAAVTTELILRRIDPSPSYSNKSNTSACLHHRNLFDTFVEHNLKPKLARREAISMGHFVLSVCTSVQLYSWSAERLMLLGACYSYLNIMLFRSLCKDEGTASASNNSLLDRYSSV